MATSERSFTSPDLVNRKPGQGPVRTVSAAKRAFRQSRAAAYGTNKVRAGLKKLEKLGIL
jgi:hypothetical protein